VDAREQRLREVNATTEKEREMFSKQSQRIIAMVEYNDKLRSDVAVTRRAAYKAEQSLVDREKEKLSQDSIVVLQEEEKKRLQDEMAFLQTQWDAQQMELGEAQRILGR
ncbi:hypothetical protein KIPB_003725, partial [Kipferlia bialata]